jgi:hypothetical protein
VISKNPKFFPQSEEIFLPNLWSLSEKEDVREEAIDMVWKEVGNGKERGKEKGFEKCYLIKL